MLENLIFVVLNSLDVLYHIVLKRNLNPQLVYIALLIPAILFFSLKHIKKILKGKITSIEILAYIYILFKLVQALIYNLELRGVMVTFLSMSLINLIYSIYKGKSREELKLKLKKIMNINMLYLVVIDILSIIVMRKSQHVILFNAIPFLLLTKIVTGNKSKKIYLYIIWSTISVLFFTVDKRVQLKAVGISIFLMLGSMILEHIFKNKIKNRERLVKIVLVIGLLSTILVVKELDTLIKSRSTSIGLRIEVGKAMLEDLSIRENPMAFVFGKGIGSSDKVFYESNYGPLKSHSGLLSIFYEHGIIGLLFLIIIFKKMIESTRLHKEVILFIILYLTLNMIYGIGVPVSDYSSQRQIILITFIALLIKEKRNLKNDKNILRT